MTDRVPQFPGKPNAVGKQPDPEPWKQFMCPYSLSGAVSRLGPSKGLIETVGAQAEEACIPLPCSGPRCALFIQAGAMAGCAHTVAVLETNRLANLMGRFLDAVSQPEPATETPATETAAPTTPPVGT